jgi:hypothetical protein
MSCSLQQQTCSGRYECFLKLLVRYFRFGCNNTEGFLKVSKPQIGRRQELSLQPQNTLIVMMRQRVQTLRCTIRTIPVVDNYKRYSVYILYCIYASCQNTTKSDGSNKLKINSYMFRPFKWAIVRLSMELSKCQNM